MATENTLRLIVNYGPYPHPSDLLVLFSNKDPDNEILDVPLAKGVTASIDSKTLRPYMFSMHAPMFPNLSDRIREMIVELIGREAVEISQQPNNAYDGYVTLDPSETEQILSSWAQLAQRAVSLEREI